MQYSSLASHLVKSNNPIGSCLVVLLVWIMASDGHVDDEERAFLSKFAESFSPQEIQNLISGIHENKLFEVQVACECLQMLASQEDQKKILELLIVMAVSDGYLHGSEQQIIYFVADLFDVGKERLFSVFREVTGQDMPPPGEFSSRRWWDERGESKHGSSKPGPSDNGHERAKAYGLLGLDMNASVDDVKAAFRRLAMVHHPDKFHSLGPEAVKAAEESFIRIKWAYEFLTAT